MKRGLPSLAAIVAAIGTFGLVQVRAVSIQPPWWGQALIFAGLLVAALLASRSSRHKLPPMVEKLERNPSRRHRRPYLIDAKRLRVTMEPGISIRRDALLQWEIELRNRSKSALGAIDFNLLGDVPVFGSDLTVLGRTGAQTVPLAAMVDRGDGLSPTLTITLPAPGLRPKDSLTVAFEYVWPAIAHVHENNWVVDLRNAAASSSVHVTLDFPAADAQLADVHVYRRSFGTIREHVLGHLLPETMGDRALVELAYTTRHGDELVVLYTRPFAPGSPPVDGDPRVAQQSGR